MQLLKKLDIIFFSAKWAGLGFCAAGIGRACQLIFTNGGNLTDYSLFLTILSLIFLLYWGYAVETYERNKSRSVGMQRILTIIRENEDCPPLVFIKLDALEKNPETHEDVKKIIRDYKKAVDTNTQNV